MLLSTSTLRVVLCSVSFPISQWAHAQVWQIHATAGTSMGRLIPATGATTSSAETRYVIMGPGVFCGASVELRAGEHQGFSLQGQLAVTPVGIRHTPKYIVGSVTRAADELFSRTLTLGYSWHASSESSPIQLTATGLAGVCYTTMIGVRLSSSSGLVEQYGGNGANVPAARLTGKEVIEPSLSPCLGAGVHIGPNFSDKVADRLSLSFFTNVLLQNPYKAPSEVYLKYAVNQSAFGKTVRYRGTVVMCQIGIDYVLFRQRDKFV